MIPGGGTLIWVDNFNTLSPIWTTRETQYTDKTLYARASTSCARVRNGELILSVRPDPDSPGKYLTGHVGTENFVEFQPYGYYEAKIVFPPTRGVLCGWWLQTTEDYIPGQAEIDIAECGGVSKIHHTIWYRDPGQLAGQFHEPPPHLVTDLPKDAQTLPHTYGVLWEPTRYTFYIDREPVGILTEGLSDRPKYPILSIKVPNYLVDDLDPSNLREQKMRVKYVKVWQ